MKLATVSINRDPWTFTFQMPKWGAPSEDEYEEAVPAQLPELGFTYYDPDKVAPILAATKLIQAMQDSLAAKAAQYQMDVQRLERIREGLVEHYRNTYEVVDHEI